MTVWYIIFGVLQIVSLGLMILVLRLAFNYFSSHRIEPVARSFLFGFLRTRHVLFSYFLMVLFLFFVSFIIIVLHPFTSTV